MNKLFITILSVFLASNILSIAYAALSPTGATVGDLDQAIMDIEDNTLIWDGAPLPALPLGCEIKKVVFARGIQSYKYDAIVDNKWKATGPLAELFEIVPGDLPGDPILVHEGVGEKIGTHYQHLSKPAWEFPNGLRVIVESAFKIEAPIAIPGTPGIPGSLVDVKWLNVGLRNGSVKVQGADNKDKIKNKDVPDRLYRVLTSGGVAPIAAGSHGETTGSGYTTFYVFLKCP